MKIPASIFISLFLAAQTVSGQVSDMDATAGSELAAAWYLPDVEGNISIGNAVFSFREMNFGSAIPTVYPLWPLARPGKNEEGAVYGNLDSDPELELIFTVGTKVYAFNRTGTNVNGWPRTLDFPTDGAPAFGDIDGDGIGEIVVTVHQPTTFATGAVYAFEVDGADVPGFPVLITGGPLRTPVLADLDGDDALEIIIAVRKHPEGFIHVYRGDGTMLPNWPQPLDYVPGSAVAAGDITGDDIPEIIAQSYYGIFAFSAEGSLLPGFPYYPDANRVFSYSSPVLADIDDDGFREIICGDHSIDQGNGAIHIVRNDGSPYPGWPQLTNYWVYSPPSVGDINGDGLLDIVVGDQTLSANPLNQVYGWTAMTANPLPGFPITGIWSVNSQIILADIDGDGLIELMFDDNTSAGKYQGYNHDGTPMEGWPLPVDGTTFYVCPLIFDINLDGGMDIAGAGYDQGTGNLNIYLWNANVPMNNDLAILPVLQYNTRHNGVYGDYLMVGIQEPDVPDEFSLNIYPNPAIDQLAVGSQQSAIGSPQSMIGIIIYDLVGRPLKSISDLFFLPYQVDISGMPAGIYIVRIISEEGRSSSARFVKIDK